MDIKDWFFGRKHNSPGQLTKAFAEEYQRFLQLGTSLNVEEGFSYMYDLQIGLLERSNEKGSLLQEFDKGKIIYFADFKPSFFVLEILYLSYPKFRKQLSNKDGFWESINAVYLELQRHFPLTKLSVQEFGVKTMHFMAGLGTDWYNKDIKTPVLANQEFSETDQYLSVCATLNISTAVRLWRTTVAICNQTGARSKLLYVDNICMHPQWKYIDRGAEFHMYFELLPSNGKTFDILEEIPEPDHFHLHGIERNDNELYSVTFG